MSLAKIVLFLLSALLLVSEGNMPVEDSFTKAAKYNGQVKLVAEKTYKPPRPDFKYFSFDSCVTTFDREGHALLKKGYDKTGSLIYTDTFKYDNKNNVLENVGHNSRGKTMSTVTFKYDTTGKKVMKYYYGGNGKLWETTIYKYDDIGNCIEKLHCTHNGDSCGVKSFYKYENGLNTQMTRISDKGNPIQNLTVVYTYNVKGQIISDTTYSSEGNIRSVALKKYDDQGNILRLEGWSSFRNNVRNSFCSIYSYTYDEHNNWIKMKQEDKGIILLEAERIIEYY